MVMIILLVLIYLMEGRTEKFGGSCKWNETKNRKWAVVNWLQNGIHSVEIIVKLRFLRDEWRRSNAKSELVLFNNIQ